MDRLLSRHCRLLLVVLTSLVGCWLAAFGIFRAAAQNAAAPPSIAVAPVIQFPAASDPTGLVYGPENAFWLTLGSANAIAAFTVPSTTITLPVPALAAQPFDLVLGSGQDIWFTEQSANQIGRLHLATREFFGYPLTDTAAYPAQIILGQDGALWFTKFEGNQIGRITPAGQLTSYPLPNPDSRPLGIVSAPDGSLWFTEWGGYRIARLTMEGNLTEYAIPAAISKPSAITLGPDGALWFTYEFGPFVGRIDPATAAIQTFSLPTQSTSLLDLTCGPDGQLWFLGVGNIGRFAASASGPANLIETTIPAIFESQGRSQIIAGPGAEMFFITGNSQNVFTASVPGGMSGRDVQIFLDDLPPVLLAGGEFTVTAKIHNWSSNAAAGVQIVLPLDADIQFKHLATPSGSIGCNTVNQTVTCPLGIMPALGSLPITLTLEALQTGPYPANRRFDVRVALQETDFQPANNRTFRNVTVVAALDYFNDFALGSDAFWSPTQTHQTEGGLVYLGMFANDPVTFHWKNLPPHDSVSICFDVYVLGAWDGSASLEPSRQSPASNFIGPDLWSFYLDAQRVLVSSFSNRPDLAQSYPDLYPEGTHPAQQNAQEVGDFDDAPDVVDARYRMCRTLSHTGENLTANFNGINLNELLDEKWALDNVFVQVFYRAGFDFLYLPLVTR